MMNKNNFEESIQKLEEIIKQFQKSDLFLEDSIQLYEKGIHLIQHCEEKLNQAENKVYILKNQFLKKGDIQAKDNSPIEDPKNQEEKSKLETKEKLEIKEKKGKKEKSIKEPIKKKVSKNEQPEEEIPNNFELFDILE